METIIGILFPTTFVLALLLERIFSARELPKVRRWVLKGLVFFVVSSTVGLIIPTLIAGAIAPYAPLHLGALGTALGGILGFLCSDIVYYGAHRLLHNVPFLWRWTHQMHHSAERMDMAGFAYSHPLDTFVLGSATTVAAVLLGLSADAAALAGYISFLVGVFQHMNVRTPQWLGWIIQRPEAHSVHHARGVHAYNYGNFMLWDIAFGTFRNPVSFTEQSGFWDGASSKLGAMLLGRDIDEPRPRAVEATMDSAELS